jgi:hypothetical protein
MAPVGDEDVRGDALLDAVWVEDEDFVGDEEGEGVETREGVTDGAGGDERVERQDAPCVLEKVSEGAADAVVIIEGLRKEDLVTRAFELTDALVLTLTLSRTLWVVECVLRKEGEARGLVGESVRVLRSTEDEAKELPDAVELAEADVDRVPVTLTLTLDAGVWLGEVVIEEEGDTEGDGVAEPDWEGEFDGGEELVGVLEDVDVFVLDVVRELVREEVEEGVEKAVAAGSGMSAAARRNGWEETVEKSRSTSGAKRSIGPTLVRSVGASGLVTAARRWLRVG